MKILIVHPDQPYIDQVSKQLDIQGHESVGCLSWAQAITELEENVYAIVLVDESYIRHAEYNVNNLRRSARGYIYVIGLNVAEVASESENGFNMSVSQSGDMNVIEKATDTAVQFILRSKQLSNENEDFPSAGGVISKSAFNQLFLGAMNRAGRYSETASVLYVSVENYKNIIVEENEYAAKHASARLAYHLSQTRRQSDILAQTNANEYAILFLRPEYEQEPLDATNRFASTLSHIKDYTTGLSTVNISLRLSSLPSGSIQAEHEFSVTPA
jgi:PleD family two-component response regulator